jgi:hypothetical protein
MILRISGCAIFLLPLIFLAACSGGSPNSITDPPSDSTPQSLAMLNGNYTFVVADQGCVCTFAAGGSFHADGAGKITSGVMDINHDGSVQTNVAITGTYTIGDNGRGSATVQSLNSKFAFRFVVLSNRRAFVIGFDTNENASGALDLQDSSQFSNTKIAGSFAFRVSGTDSFGEAMQIGGVFTLDANGISTGIVDVHDNQLIETELSVKPSGVSAVAANGRSTFTISTSFATSNYAFYVVDANHLKVIGIDPTIILFGDAYRQNADSRQVHGSYAFTTFGWTAGAPLPLSAGGIFVAESNGIISNGAQDENRNGSVTQNSQFTGQYTVADSGRGTLTLGSSSGTTTFAIYPSTAGIQMLEIDSSAITGGTAFLQAGSPFSAASLKGDFGMAKAGSTNGKNSDELAVLFFDGSGRLNGTADLNNERSPEPGLPAMGTYVISSNGRGAASLTTSRGTANSALYAVNDSLFLMLGLDNTSVMVGSLEKK